MTGIEPCGVLVGVEAVPVSPCAGPVAAAPFRMADGRATVLAENELPQYAERAFGVIAMHAMSAILEFLQTHEMPG